MNKMNKPKHNQHVLPELYLKGFAIKNDQSHIWIYKRGEQFNPGKGTITNNPYHRSIHDAGAEWDFFADPKKDGSKDIETFENILESLEKPANTIFQKLRAHEAIIHEEKDEFARYIILMYRRVWAAREKIKGWLPKTITNSKPSKELFQETNLLDTPELQARWKKKSEELGNRPGYHINLHNRTTVDAPNSFMVEALQKMIWTFYTAPNSRAFFTGDNPVFIPKNNGLGKSNSELSFPISTDVALIASWDRSRKEGFEEAKSQVVKEINHRTISQASKIYFSQDCDWIVTMLNKGEYGWHPIYSPKSVYTIAELVKGTPDSEPYLKMNI
jgi:hypothetical protein